MYRYYLYEYPKSSYPYDQYQKYIIRTHQVRRLELIRMLICLQKL